MNSPIPHNAKILSLADLMPQIPRLKALGKLVFTNGCFDLVHCGHVTYLAQARQLGASLVVALNTDDSIRLQHKGKMRPIVPLSERLQVIAALAAVDVVTYFEAATPIELISSIMPDVLVKGRDWTISSIVGADIVLQAGGSVHSIPFVHHTSTTAIIQRIITHSSK